MISGLRPVMPYFKMHGASALSLAILLPIIIGLLLFALDITRIMVVRYVLLNQVQDMGEQARLQTALKFQQHNLKSNWQESMQQGFLSNVQLSAFKRQYFTQLDDWLNQPNAGSDAPTQDTCCMQLSLTFSTPSLVRRLSAKQNWSFTFKRLIYFEGQSTP